MPLGHNRRDPEFGKVVPDTCPPEPPKGAPDVGSALLLSLGIHVLVGLLFWHGLITRQNEDRAASRIIDTRVQKPGMEVEVCLRLLDSPKQGLRRASTQPAVTDPSKTPGVAGAESSKPRQGHQDSPLFAGASKTQPHPPETAVSSRGEHLPGGSQGASVQGTGAGDGTARFFDIGTLAKSVVYVIDRSVSMGPNGGLAKAKQELLVSLQGMSDQTQFQIIIFNRSVELLSVAPPTGLLAATNENKQRAAEFLRSIQPEGGTLPVPALKRALALKPEVIFFLSDGGDWVDRQVQEVISINHGHSVIHVVDFGGATRDQLNEPLRVLASKNQGEYRAVSMRDREPWPIRGN
jgi:von Willebrand factor type A domain